MKILSKTYLIQYAQYIEIDGPLMYKLHPCIIYNTIPATDGLREGVDGT